MDNGNKNNSTGNTVLLTVIGVATLLVALVGATFAYFTATVTNNSAQSFSVTTASPVALVYTSANTLALTNAIPGQSSTSSFTVKNPSDSTVAQTYDLTLVIDSNGFVTTDGANQLVLSISATGTTSITLLKSSIDLTDGSSAQKTGTKTILVNDQRIAIGETQTYNLTLDFKELDKAQDTNQNKSFSAHILLDDTKSVK